MKDEIKEYYSPNKSCTDDKAIIHALVQLILTIRLRYPKLPRMARKKRQKITKSLLEDITKHCPAHPFVKEIKSKISDAEKLSSEKVRLQYPYWQQGNILIGKDHYQQLFPQSFWEVAKNDFLVKRLRSKFFSIQIHSLDRLLEYLMSTHFYPAPSLTEIDMKVVLNIIRGTQFNWSRHEIVQLSRKQLNKTFGLLKSRAVLMQRHAFIVNNSVVSFKHWLNVRPFGLKMFIREVFKLKNQESLSTPFQEILINLNHSAPSFQEWNLVVRREDDLPIRRKGVIFHPIQKIVVIHNLSLKNWSEFVKQPKIILTSPEKDSNCIKVCTIQRQRNKVFEFIQTYPRETIRFLEICSMYPHHKLSKLRSTFGDISLYRLKKVSEIFRKKEIVKMTATTPDFFPNRLLVSLDRGAVEFDSICSFLLRYPLGVWFYTPKRLFIFVYLSHRRFVFGLRDLLDFRNDLSQLNEEFQITLIPFSKIHSASSWFPFKLIREKFGFS